jgi:hypothetical protein
VYSVKELAPAAGAAPLAGEIPQEQACPHHGRSFRKRLEFSAKVFKPAKTFLSLFHFQGKICKKSNAMSMQKNRSKSKNHKAKQSKKSCVFLSSSRKIPFVKRM